MADSPGSPRSGLRPVPPPTPQTSVNSNTSTGGGAGPAAAAAAATVTTDNVSTPGTQSAAAADRDSSRRELPRTGSGSNVLTRKSSSSTNKAQANVKLQILSTFGLDQTETLLDEYKCYYMMSNMVPLQGRLYITQYHVCFYSNLLNVEHKLVFRARDLTHIHRRDDRTIVLDLLPSSARKQVRE